MRIGIITGSTRPTRVNLQVAKWVFETASLRTDANFELVDINDFDLPLLNEPLSPVFGYYQYEHTKKWSVKIDSLDAFIFVTPEYNHSMSAALKNAIDYLFREWNNKAAGFVGYGVMGGSRAVENLRLIMGELMIADVKNQVSLSIFTDFENFKTFVPTSLHCDSLNAMIDQLIAWGRALMPLRAA